MLRTILLFLVACGAIIAAGPVYVVLWFDTEDYVLPASDDAALRIAKDLTRLGVRATFKVVGEKARVLESRGRFDVIRALSRHDIGYHAERHSMPPTQALYLRELGYREGAAEFERREGQGVKDIRRIFGVTPSCYGQPGSSWGPQSNLALRRMGIPVYLDSGDQVGIRERPVWFGGILNAYDLGHFVMRAPLDDEGKLEEAFRQFDAAAAELRSAPGGVISIYYHPTEFVTTEFWDAVNFSHGKYTDKSQWVMPRRRTPEAAERAYRILSRYVDRLKEVPDVRFITARELPQLYQSPTPPALDKAVAAAHLSRGITFLETDSGVWSASDLLQVLLSLEPQTVEGPEAKKVSTWPGGAIPRAAFERTKADVAGYIRYHRALPSSVWVDSWQLSLADFAATLAGDEGRTGDVTVRSGSLNFEKYVSKDAAKSFDWPIHPVGFAPVELLEMARLQAWTLKPAKLR